MNRLFLLASLLVFPMAGVGCRGASRQLADTGPIAVIPKPVVVVQHPQRRTMQNVVENPADVHAWEESRLYAKVAGYLRDIRVDKGDTVVKGQLLATIDSPETAQAASAARQTAEAARSAVLETQVQITKAESQVAQMEAEVRGARARRSEAEATVLKAHGDLTLARLTYRRIRSVYDKDAGLIALQDVDVAAAAQNAAEARLSGVRQDVVAAGDGILEAQTRTVAAERQVQALRAQTRESSDLASASADAALRAHTLENYTEIRAPFSGQIIARYLDPGALVQNSATSSQESVQPVVSIADLKVVRIDVQIPESDFGTVHIGTPATLVAEELPHRLFKGRVTRMSGQFDLNSRTMLTEIDLPNADHALHPGMLVRVRLSLGSHANALTVPLTALSGDGEHRQVYVVTDDVVHRRNVTLGYQTLDHGEITSGLQGDEWVVVSGQKDVQDESPVTVQRSGAVVP